MLISVPKMYRSWRRVRIGFWPSMMVVQCGGAFFRLQIAARRVNNSHAILDCRKLRRTVRLLIDFIAAKTRNQQQPVIK